MGQHTSARAVSGQRRGWRRAAIAGISIGVAFGTFSVVGLASGTTTSTPSVYSSVAPVTVLGRSLAAHSNTDVAVAGIGSVPSNATSVQLSVTALDGTTTSSMYVYSTGATQPTSANVRWTTGEVVTIPVTVAVGTSGDIRLTTDGGTVTVKVAVVGYFSPASAPSGASYANHVGFLTLTNTLTAVATLDLPAGSYQIQGKLEAVFEGSSDSAPESVLCEIIDPKDNEVDISGVYVSTSLPAETVSVDGLDTTSGGTFNLDCANSVNANAYNIAFVAVQSSSATGDVSAG
jgi:hypothetical protein